MFQDCQSCLHREMRSLGPRARSRIRSQDQILALNFHFILNLLTYFWVSGQGPDWPQIQLCSGGFSWISDLPEYCDPSPKLTHSTPTVISDVCTQCRQLSHWVRVLLTCPPWRGQCVCSRDWDWVPGTQYIFLPCRVWQALFKLKVLLLSGSQRLALHIDVEMYIVRSCLVIIVLAFIFSNSDGGCL